MIGLFVMEITGLMSAVLSDFCELPSAGQRGVERQTQFDSPGAVFGNHELPVREYGDALVNQFKSGLRLTDGFNGIGPQSGGFGKFQRCVDSLPLINQSNPCGIAQLLAGIQRTQL